MTLLRTTVVAGLGMGLALSALGAPTASADPEVGSPAYVERDTRNIADAYGRQAGPGGQAVTNANYMAALNTEIGPKLAAQLIAQAASPTRPALTPGLVFPGWNVGNPLRADWAGTRGRKKRVAFTNKFGARLRGTVWAPKRNARDPYNGKKLKGPFPGVVITTGSVQGSEGMYEWLAQDLAERGYVVLTYDVQGQGQSETFPHQNSQVNALPFCNPFATPADGEMTGCPGVPSQQESNFVVGTKNALGFFTSTPKRNYRNPGAGNEPVNDFNPFWRLWDRKRDKNTKTKGRNKKLAIIGHSLGASAVSKVQEKDRRVAAVVALDKLVGSGDLAPGAGSGNKPKVPALAIQSEYGFTVAPWFAAGESSLRPQPSPNGPDPRRERITGFDAWKKAKVDSMLIVPRASTHLDYTDIPLVLPASRHGQGLTSVYTQAWLDRYLKHKGGIKKLLKRQYRYLEPVSTKRWQPLTLRRKQLLSFYFCSAYSLEKSNGNRRGSGDISDVGC